MKTTLVLLAVISFWVVGFARPPIAWKRTLPKLGDQGAICTVQMPDGGYLIGGTQVEQDLPRTYLVRTNELGDTLWTRRLQTPQYGAEEVCATSDGGFVVVGTGSPQAYALAVVKMDSSGAEQWHYVDADTNQTQGYAIQQTGDGGYIAAGNIFFAGRIPYHNVYEACLNADGTLRWARNQGSNDNDWGGYDVICLADGNYLAVGSVDCVAWLPGGYSIKLHANGTTAWTRNWCEDDGYHKSFAACQRQDGNIVIVGVKYFYTSGHYEDISVEGRASNGAGVFASVFGGTGTEVATGVTATPENGVIVAGVTNSYGAGGQDAWILGLDSVGNEDWEYVLGNGGNDGAADVIRTADGGYLVSGYSNTGGATGNDVWLIKLCPEGTDAAHPEPILFGPRTDAYKLVWEGGQVDRLVLSGLPLGISGWVSGEAANSWTATSAGDSIVFQSTIPLITGTIDTFFTSLPDSCYGFRWRTGCRRDTLSTFRHGHIAVLTRDSSAIGFELYHDQGLLTSVEFAGTEPGSVGWTTGEAGIRWTALPNGDGNNGDSVIFQALQPFTSGTIDTFWISPPPRQCILQCTIGCAHDTVFQDFVPHIDSVHFSGAVFSHYVELIISTFDEDSIAGYRILRRFGSIGVFQTIGFVASINDSAAHGYRYTDPTGVALNQYTVEAQSIDGCRHEYRDLIISQGHGLPIVQPPVTMPQRFTLSSFPNPFNPTTTLAFTLARAGKTKIVIYDITGREVRTLSDQMFEAGEHKIMFDGSTLPSGIYFARMMSGEFVATQKLLLLK